jgi:hypothetical protein
VAVIEQGPHGTRRVPIPDPTSRAVRTMAWVAVVAGVALALVGGWLARAERGGEDATEPVV